MVMYFKFSVVDEHNHGFVSPDERQSFVGLKSFTRFPLRSMFCRPEKLHSFSIKINVSVSVNIKHSLVFQISEPGWNLLISISVKLSFTHLYIFMILTIADEAIHI
jgi:hypothetical protein